MTTFIIGGLGFIGRRITSLLVEQGEDVVCFDVGPVPPTIEQLGAKVRLVRGDIRQFDELHAAMYDVKPERAINLAYFMDNDRPPHVALKLNVIGMDNFFEASRLTKVDHVLFGSSLAVAGAQSYFGDRSTTEEDHRYGDRQYATHKIFNEQQAADYRAKHGMRITAIRPANVTGPDKVGGSVDHVEIITEPARGKAVRFPHADAMRCPIYVDDVAEIFARLTLAPVLQHTVYNTGGTPVSLGAIADLVRAEIPDAQIEFDNQEGGRVISSNYFIDNSRLINEFGFTFPSYETRVGEIIEAARRLQ